MTIILEESADLKFFQVLNSVMFNIDNELDEVILQFAHIVIIQSMNLTNVAC